MSWKTAISVAIVSCSLIGKTALVTELSVHIRPAPGFSLPLAMNAFSCRLPLLGESTIKVDPLYYYSSCSIQYLNVNEAHRNLYPAFVVTWINCIPWYECLTLTRFLWSAPLITKRLVSHWNLTCVCVFCWWDIPTNLTFVNIDYHVRSSQFN
jgi:hypothetical protein